MKIISINRIAPDGTLCFAVSHLGLICLPMSHEKDARHIWVKLVCCSNALALKGNPFSHDVTQTSQTLAS